MYKDAHGHLFTKQKYGDKVNVHYWGMACIKFIKQQFRGLDLYGLPTQVRPLGAVKSQKQANHRYREVPLLVGTFLK